MLFSYFFHTRLILLFQSGFYMDFLLKKCCEVFIKNVFIYTSQFFGEKYFIEVLTKKIIDKLPDKKEKVAMFINWISIKNNGLCYKEITEVDSAKDDIMQIVDIILGSIQFKLNKQNEV